MYRCKECNAEYKTKPDYCECGNDTFEFIKETLSKKPLTLEQKSEIISKIFFIACILLSVLVWLIPTKKTTPSKAPTKPELIKNIPDINQIWKDTTVKPVQIDKLEDNNIQNLKNFEQQKEINNTVIIPEQPKQSSQKITETNTKKQLIQEQKPKQTVTKPTSPPQAKKTEIKYNPNSPEMLSYKGALRAALFAKFAVGSIQGNGNCSIQFSIDKNGKLINRKFTKESNNKTLNDSVYYMLMSVPKFTPPPENYNEEPINMNFSINNGHYEISIH